MDKEQKGFVVYGDIKAVIDKLNNDQVAELFRGMVDYFVTGEVPEFTDVLDIAFVPIKQQMDRDAAKYEKKCRKMRENANKRWDSNSNNAIAYNGIQLDANDANTKTNTNTKTNKDINTMPDSTGLTGTSSSLLKYLNEKTGSNFSLTLSIKRAISALLDAGYTPDQIRIVIDKKCAEWLHDEKMRPYLRPSTLFGDKFAEYLAAPIPLEFERAKEEKANRADLTAELEQKRGTLVTLKESLNEIPGGTRMNERRILKEQIAQLEDSIGLIERRLS